MNKNFEKLNYKQPLNLFLLLPFSFYIMLYWFFFWFMNGLDKFVNRTDFGIFTWYGKDRTGQFTNYLNNMSIDQQFVDEILVFAGLWEFFVGFFCFAAVVFAFKTSFISQYFKFSIISYRLSLITFIGFSIFDIIVGDRAELLEHGTYIALLLVGFALLIWEKKCALSNNTTT